jgi:hypothetical protein
MRLHAASVVWATEVGEWLNQKSEIGRLKINLIPSKNYFSPSTEANEASLSVPAYKNCKSES